MGFILTLHELLRYLEHLGFTQEEGGRHQIRMRRGSTSIAVPSHTGDIPKGTVCAIIRQAGSTAQNAKKWKEGGYK